MSSHQNKNRVKTVLFAITLLYMWQCSDTIPQVRQDGDRSVINTQFSNTLYKHYVGCFSKRILDKIVTEMMPKFILYKPLLIQEQCFSSCQSYFEDFPRSVVNLIAIQYHVCICIPVFEGPILLYKVTESHCDLKSDSEHVLYVGGTNSLSLYTKDIEDYESFFLLQKNLFEVRRVTEVSLQENVEENPYPIASFQDLIQPCPNEQCTLRINIEGEICKVTFNKTYRWQSLDTPKAVSPFLEQYLPKSMENPFLCLQYCSKFFENRNIQGHRIPKYSIQSTTYWVSPLQEPIELCHCTDILEESYPVAIEKCIRCPNSWNEKQRYCESFDFRHRIYDNSARTRRSTTIVPEDFTAPEDFLTPNNNRSAGQLSQTNNTITLCSEENQCKAKDSYGREWQACPRETASAGCPTTSEPGGKSFWQCSSNGTFIGEAPDFDNCTSQDLLKIETNYNKTEFGSNSPKKDREVLIQLRNLVTTQQGPQPQPQSGDSKGAKYFGHDIEKINDIVQNAVRSPSENFAQRDSKTTEAIEVLGNLIATSGPWRQLDPRSRSTTVTNLFASVENTLFHFAEESNNEISNQAKNGFYRKRVNPIARDPNGFVVTLGARKKAARENIKFPAESDSSYIKIPENPRLQQQELRFVGMIMESKYVNNLTAPNFKQPNKNQSSAKRFNGKIISLTFENKDISRLATENGVQVKFAHEVKAIGSTRSDFRRQLHPGEERKYVLGETKCAYWDTNSLLWSTDGCRKLEDPSNSEETVCECNHLTAFAVLTDVHGYVGKDKGLEIITLILCPLSIVCLIATIVILSRMKVLHGERTTITKHLCVNLIIGNILLLLLVDRNYFFLSQIGCTVVGIITHYMFLAAFGWMAVQGLYLYRMIVLIFDSGKNYMPLYTIGAYCFPLIPIVLTAGIGYGVGDQPYGGEMYCWLNGDYIWAFMGPVAVILFGNFIVMVLTMRTVSKQQSSKFRSHNQIKSNRKWIQGCCAISVLLGLTWITAFFTLLDDPSFHFFSYIFTIANSSQGVFILIFYCLLHEKVKPLVLDKMGIVGSVFSKKKGSSSSATFSKRTSSTKLPDGNSRTETENQSQSEGICPVVEEDETEDADENSQETLQLSQYNEDLNRPEEFPRRALSVVLEAKSETESEESENDLLSDTRQPRAKPRRQRRIEEENESEDSEQDKSTEFEQGEHPEPKRRQRRFKGPPYMDELLESNLYLRFSKIDAERDE